jgi:sirohydrochlorin cobaltochelatase
VAEHKVLICTKGKTCRKRGAKEVYCALQQQIEDQGLEDEIRLKKVDCLGRCGRGPTVKVKPFKVWYGGVSPADCRELIGSILRKTPLSRLKLNKI